MGGVAEMVAWSPGYLGSKACCRERDDAIFFLTELEGEVIVTLACPGFVATDMGSQSRVPERLEAGGSGGGRHRRLATLPDDGPTGGFFRDGNPVTFSLTRAGRTPASWGAAWSARSRMSFQVIPSRRSAGMPKATAVAISTAWRMIP